MFSDVGRHQCLDQEDETETNTIQNLCVGR